jgi:hypothetical protein
MLTLLCLVAGALALTGTATAADTTVVVNPSNLAGWTIANDGVAAEVPYAFSGASAATGAGSLQFEVDGPMAADKFFLVAPYDGAVAALESFSYQYEVTTASSVDTQNLYANVYVDSSANGVGAFATWYDCRFDLVPPAGETAGVWHTASFGPSTTFTNVAKPLASCPDALGDLPAGSEVMFIVLNGGQSTASDNGLAGGFDDVEVDTTSGTTTYDFEPATTCATSTSGTTITLLADCTVTSTFTVPGGFTLDGNGNAITAVDPTGGHFLGAVVKAGTGGGPVHVTDLEVTASGLADVCDGPGPPDTRLRGILFDGVGGSITGVNVHGVRQGLSGCQEGNAIETRNFSVAGPLAVTISGNTVSDYQKNAITANGDVAATITGNVVTGDGNVSYIAQNGIQIGFGATALVTGNTVSGNWYTAPVGQLEYDACGILLYQAAGVRQSKNTLFGNEKNLCNAGRGGGRFAPA